MNPVPIESVSPQADMPRSTTASTADQQRRVPTRFGLLPVEPHQVWLADSPLPGFESLPRYALIGLQNERPFLWLQSIDDGAVSFLLTPAAHFGLRYAHLDEASQPLVMVLLPSQPGQALRAHAQAPLVFDAQTGRFAQHIVEASEVEGDGVFAPQAGAPLPPELATRLLALSPS